MTAPYDKPMDEWSDDEVDAYFADEKRLEALEQASYARQQAEGEAMWRRHQERLAARWGWDLPA